METVEFLVHLGRMCEKHPLCKDCPIQNPRKKYHYSCISFISRKPADVVEVVEKWARENPVKTRLKDFYEKYPNAPMYQGTYPQACCRTLGYCQECPDKECDCLACWTTPIDTKTK